MIQQLLPWLIASALVAVLVTPVVFSLVLRSITRRSRPDLRGAGLRTLTNRLHRGTLLGLGGIGLIAIGLGEPRVMIMACLILLTVAMAAADWRWYWLPLEWTLGLLASGLALAWLGGHLLESLLAAVVTALAFEALRFAFRLVRGIEGLGGGDVILCAGIAAHLGVEATAHIVLIASLVALAGQLIPRRQIKQVPVAFGLYLCLTFTAFLLMPVVVALVV